MTRWTHCHEYFLTRLTPASESTSSSPHGQLFVELCKFLLQLCRFRFLVGHLQTFDFLVQLLIGRQEGRDGIFSLFDGFPKDLDA